MNNPLVSILICTFNGEAYLQQQLDSLEKQTYKNVQIICSDNNSTDTTPRILQEWCSKADNRMFTSIAEKGLNKNFFHALTLATGTYISFCDQDDIWMPEKIEKLVKFHEKFQQASMVYCLSIPFDGDTLPNIDPDKKGIIRLEGTEIKKTMLVSFTLGHNILIKKNVLDMIPVPADEVIAYDWWITVSAMCIGPIQCLHEVLTYWRQHPENTTKVLNKDLFYESRVAYLNTFLKNELISPADKEWIRTARDEFETLNDKSASFSLFSFLLKNAPLIFFYKRRGNVVSKWISYTKWARRMSKRKYRP